jgi:hypothetical protein
MSTERTSPRRSVNGSAPTAPSRRSAVGEGEDLRRLGRALTARRDDAVARIAAASRRAGLSLEDSVEQRFRQIGALSTVAVAGWMSGDDLEVAR